MARRDFLPWRYTDDSNRTYVRRGDAQIVTQNNGADPPVGLVGGGNPSADDPYPPEFPTSWKPRGVRVSDTSGFGSFVCVYSTTAPLWGATPPTITLLDKTGASHTCSVDEKVQEKRGRRKKKEATP
jgi:hypothetical protein